jgi:hypothetical protein
MTVKLVDARGQRVGAHRSSAAAHRSSRKKAHAGSHLRLVHNRAAATSARPGFVRMGGRDVFSRDFYVPPAARGQTPIEIEDLQIYLYPVELVSGESRYGAVIFAGKAQKPIAHHTYRTSEARDKHIAEFIRSRRGTRQRREKRTAEKKSYRHDFKVGDVLNTHWGWEQTNVEFYQVVDVRGADIVVREIASRSVAGPKQACMTDEIVAVPDKFVGPPIRVRPTGDGVKIERHYAQRWDGSPEHTSSYA